MKKGGGNTKRYVPKIMEFNNYGGGGSYLISNTGVSETSVSFPEAENFAAPPVRIVEAEGCLSETDLRELLRSSCYDDDPADPIFAEQYEKAVLGELDGWRLYAIGINAVDAGLTFAVANEATQDEYHEVWLWPRSPLKLMFETEEPNGNTIRYLYEVDITGGIASKDNRPRLLKVTEAFDSNCPKEIYFRIGGWFEPEHIGEPWQHYWLVREYRQS